MTTLKTIVRSNPGILELQKGTIMQKLHWNDASELKLKKVGKESAIDLKLKNQLDSIQALDQRYRALMQLPLEERKAAAQANGFEENDYSDMTLWNKQMMLDSTNMIFVSKVFSERGYPGRSVVGEESAGAAWYVLQHSPNSIPEYFPMIKKAGEEGELKMTLVAMMEDRLLMGQGKPQIYGTQGREDDSGVYIWPIRDPESVNERRVKAGFTQTVEEYGKDLFGADFVYTVRTMDSVNQ
jgi:hypothetical protein